MYISLKPNQRNIFDLHVIPGMTVIFSDDVFTTTAHSEAAYVPCASSFYPSIIKSVIIVLLVPSSNHSTDDIPNKGHSIGQTKANH